MVAKACPACGGTFDWPLYTQSVKCPQCGETLSLDRPAPVRSEAGSRIMLIGIAVLVVGLILAVVH